MWFRNILEINKYIPDDNKWKDIQILNNDIYVNGNLMNPSMGIVEDLKIFKRVLDETELP